ncbi:recombinase family protein [Nocardia thailandica]
MQRAGTYGIYLRQSLDLHDDRLAIGRQRKETTALAADRGITDTVEYVDNDISAIKGKRSGEGKGTRPAYDRMVADIEAGKIVGVIALDLDRLYRQPKDLEHLIDLAEQDGLVLYTCGGDADLSTDSGRLFARIKAAVAKAESERKSARHKLAHQQRAEAGIPWGNRRPFGYVAPDEFTPHPAEAPLVAAAYADLLAGIKVGAIAAQWRKQGVKTTLGGEWTGPRLSDFLRHPRNAGHLVHLGEITKRAAFPPLVDEATWLAAQGVLSEPGRDPRGGDRARKYLLTGLALCGVCRVPLNSGHQRGVPMYICRAPGCMKIGRKLERVDDLIEGLTVARLSRPDAAELLVDRHRVDLDELRREAAAAAAKLVELAAAFSEDEITREQLRTGTAKARARLQRAESAMADSERVRVFQGLIGPDVDVEAAWDELRRQPGGLARRRAVIRSLMVIEIRPTRRGARFTPDDIHVEWIG